MIIIFPNIPKYTVGIYTLGCRVNQYESDVIADEFEKLGFSVLSPEISCDAYVINTCTVTAESDRKSRQFIRRAIKHNPNAVIAVTGCFAQVSPENAALEGVALVCGNDRKTDIPKMVLEILNKRQEKNVSESIKISVGNIESAEFEPMRISISGRTRAYVKIEDGCESNCAYCIIPKARGRVRSKPFDVVVDEVKDIANGGCEEVILTGIETASYGIDFPRDENGHRFDLADLLIEINKIDKIKRIRLGSLDPSVMKHDFVNKIAKLEKVMPQFHLSMQSGCDNVLRLMRRRYNTAQAEEKISFLREAIPNVMLTTDMLTGFPGETDLDFEETLEFCRRVKFFGMHIFPYSKRKGTDAASMKNQVDESIKHVRASKLANQQKEIRRALLEDYVKNNKSAEVLFETCENGIAVGHTPEFVEVSVKYSGEPDEIRNRFMYVNLIGTDGDICFGEIQ